MVGTEEVAKAKTPSEVLLAEEFNKLDGITLQECHTHFGVYLKRIKDSMTSPEARISLCRLLKPTSRLEEVFYTKILLEFQDSRGLLNILTGNNVPLRKLVLTSKFFSDVLINNFDEVISEEFSKDICFLVRLRIFVGLGNIFQDDDRLDKYYKVVRKQYGLNLAKHLLPACNLTTITEEMAKNKVVFNNKQLTKLHKRFPNFVEDYFNHLKQNNIKNFNKFDKLVKHIAITDMRLYYKLLKTHELKTTLSKSATIRFVYDYKKLLLKNGEKYLAIMHTSVAFAELSLEEFPLLYSKFFPKSFNDVSVDLFATDGDIIKCLRQRSPRKYQFNILKHVFKTLYDCNLLDYDDLINEELLAIVPANLREPIIAKKMAKDENKDNWLAFYDLDKALRIIKEKISKTTDANKRRYLVNCLVKTCTVNNDIPRLAEVFDYIITRHRNEDSALFNNIFSELYGMDFEKFNGDHWESLNKMWKIFQNNKQDNAYYADYRMNKFIEGYWAYKLKNNLSIVEDVTNHVLKNYRDYNIHIFQEKKYIKQRRILLDILGEIVPKLFKDSPENVDFRRACNFFLHSIVDSNTLFKNDKVNISKYPFLIKYINDTMDNPADDDSHQSNIFGMCKDLRYIKETAVYKKVCDELWNGRAEFYEERWLFFLKYHPEYIAKNYEQFYEHTWFNNFIYEFIEKVQYHSHLGIPQLYYKKSKEILTGPDYAGHNLKYNAAVRFLVNSDEFSRVVEKFLPAKAYDETIIDDEVNIVQIKKTISSVLGNYKNLEDVLKAVLAFSKSDYLKNCLQSIYKIVYNLPDSKLTRFIEEIGSGKISVSKHVIFISTRICAQDKVHETLKTIGLNQKDSSVQKYLIRATFSYFNANPSDEFFKLVKDHCKLLTEYDSEGFDLLLNFDKMPAEYLSKYVEFLWDFTQGSNFEEVREVKYKILQKIDKDLIKTFKEEFLDLLVTKCLNFEKKDADKLYDFIYRYILIGNSVHAPQRVYYVVKQFPKSVAAKDMQLSKNLLNFTLGFCENILGEYKKDTLNAATIFGKFKEVWSLNYSVENSFEQAITLELTEIFLETANYNQANLLQKTSASLNNLLQKYSNYIIPNVATTFRKTFFTLIKIQELQDDEELLKFLLEFLKIETNITQVDKEYFVLLTLPQTLPKANNAKEKHLSILEILEKSESSSIKMNLTCYINSLEEKKDEAGG